MSYSVRERWAKKMILLRIGTKHFYHSSDNPTQEPSLTTSLIEFSIKHRDCVHINKQTERAEVKAIAG